MLSRCKLKFWVLELFGNIFLFLQVVSVSSWLNPGMWILQTEGWLCVKLSSRLFASNKIPVFLCKAYLVLLCFTGLHFFFFFDKWNVVTVLCQTSQLTFFQKLLLSLCVCHFLVIIAIFQAFSLLYNNDLWSLMLLLQNLMHWRLRW